MAKEKIKYLIKFVKEKKHATDLQDGKLFMRPSIAYVKMFYDEYFKKHSHYSEETFFEFAKNYTGSIGDFSEARLIGQFAIKANSNIPIFCLTYITNSQVDDSRKIIMFDKKLIDEFIDSDYKYAVLIDFDKFEKNLDYYLEEKQLLGGYGPVIYTKLKSLDEIKDCFMNMRHGKNLLYKDSYFRHQREFRIFLSNANCRYTTVIYDTCYKLFKTELNSWDRKEITELPSHVESIDNLKNYSTIYNISDFVLLNDKYQLSFTETANE